MISRKDRVAFDKESIIGLIIWFSCVLYSSLRTASKSSKITMSENILVQDNGAGKYKFKAPEYSPYWNRDVRREK